MPSQVDEEAHQLSYLNKHIANMLSLLAESVEGEGDQSMVGNHFKSFILSFFLSYILWSLLYDDITHVICSWF